MSTKRYIISLVISFIVLCLLGYFFQKLYFSGFESRYHTRIFNKILADKEQILEECLNSMKPILANADHHGSVPENDLFSVAEENKITILEFFDNRLVYWSDNDFDVPSFYDDSLYHKPIIFLQNGWFLPRTIEAGNEKIVGLLRIRYDYSVNNNIIKSGFAREFRVPEKTGFSFDPDASEFHISNKSGKFLFSLVFPKDPDSSFIYVPLLLWGGAFLILMLIILEVFRILREKNKCPVGFIVTLVFFSALYLMILWFGMPAVFRRTEFFSPYIFSLNKFIPGMGHLFILGIAVAFLSGIFYRFVPVTAPATRYRNIYAVLSFIFAAGILVLIHRLFSQMIVSSNVNFQPYKVLELNIYSIAGFTSIFLLILVPVIFLLKFLRSISNTKSSILLLYLIPALILIAIALRNDINSFIAVEVFFIILSVILFFSVKYQIRIFTQTVLFSIVFGIYALFFIITLTDKKTEENIKVQAVSFSTENDPTAEQLLLDIWPMISNDSLLAWMMKSGSFNVNKEDVDMITAYLQETYFMGYFANFNLNLVFCRNDEPLSIGPEDEIYDNCFRFFDERIKRNGQKLTGTEFYFIDNQGGRSYYLGRIIYKGEGEHLHGLFIELYNDVNVFQPGYSSLLLDRNYHGYAGLKDYSFAKYINGELVLSSGEFPFDKTDAQYVENISDYRFFRSEGFRHILYKNGNSTVIISRPELTAGDIIISFAYIFAFVLLLSNLLIMLIRPPRVKGMQIFNFRQKLQFSYVAILLVSFVLIGIVVAYLTITQYRQNHYENIREKLNSVYLELDNRLSMEKRLDSDWENDKYSSLNELLISLSNSFNTDINLYDVNGKLIATSRPEVFYRNLTGRRINNIAYINLRDFTRSEYYQKEKIGNLEYLSAYTPFFSTDGKVLAFLNLPYFRMQSVLAREISNLIVAVINFTLLLILVTMSFAVVISGRLTAPLTMLSDGLASVKLGRKTEHLNYEGNDEIGELVKQYNIMVDELEESAHKLADTEREYAWREMAKQIAHEIKNPLTPMKLNVQQLLKSWKDNVPGFGERLEHFTKNQIEYIDNLSSIASAFSSFAKMPGAKPTEVDLIDQIRITLELFRDTEKTTFNVKWPDVKKVVVYADKEHLNGIFSNLIKNGIQSIPPEREGIINLSLEIYKDKALISVSDNGTGIPIELQRKLFTPNFTTKSSGMGLGLSIVRKYVETSGGRIWFESEDDKGSTFFVELPVKYTVEKY
jgi:signal transduction histidine kinase